MSSAVQQTETKRRWTQLEMLQAEFPQFETFLQDCMEDLMGFVCTDVQKDIGKFLQYGPQYLMIQAQRSQAKSSIVAIYAVWCLIHDPKYRILVLSAGGDVALEIANWIIQIIMNWEILAPIRPDRGHGDRASAKSFDIHWQLKGAEKSPSVACIGVTANMQGRRADLLIADDIESSKNGLTEIQRQNLLHLSRDFTSICQEGRIAYLGTPQTTDSVYNSLPGRGYTVRVWPGRYPTPAQMPDYGDTLAPVLQGHILEHPSLQIGGGPLGDQGQPTDSVLLPETALTKKELDQGAAYFQLQHMLNTRLMDRDRYPLKTKNLVNLEMSFERGPGIVNWMPSTDKRTRIPGIPDGIELYLPFSVSDDLYEYEGRMIYVDPAGGGANGDETVATVSYFLHGYIYIAEQLCLPGGFDEKTFLALSDLALRHKVNKINVEENFGKGMFAQMWRPVILKMFKNHGLPGAPEIEDIWESGQKELRVIDTLEPVMGRHKLIMNLDVWRKDLAQAMKYPVDKRMGYTLANQMSKLSREKHALIHDDRIDSLAGAVRPWLEHAAIDEQIRVNQKATNEAVSFMESWAAGPPEMAQSELYMKPLPTNPGITRSKFMNRSPTARARHAQSHRQRQVLQSAAARRSRPAPR